MISDNEIDQLADDIDQMDIYDNRTIERCDCAVVNQNDREQDIDSLKFYKKKRNIKLNVQNMLKDGREGQAKVLLTYLSR